MSWFDLKGRSLISELDWTREEYDIAMKQDVCHDVLLRVDADTHVV
jgi:hypothetical protein